MRCRFLDQTRRLVSLFTLCSTAEEVAPLRSDVAFFDAVRAQIGKIEGPDRRIDPNAEVDTAIKQIVSEATSGAGVIDIYAEAGLERPDISLIDDDFIESLPNRPNKALTIEMVRRLLNEEIARVGRRNIVASRQFSEMLQQSILKYQNRTLDSAQIMLELADLANHIKAEHDRGARLGLTDDELTFYDAITDNASALTLGDDTLQKIAHELVIIVRRDAKTDWSVKEQRRAQGGLTSPSTMATKGKPPQCGSTFQVPRLLAEATGGSWLRVLAIGAGVQLGARSSVS